MNHRSQQHPVKQFFNRYPQVTVYLAILAVFFFSLWLDNRNQEQDEERSRAREKADTIELCASGTDSRNVDRDQTQRIYLLAMGSIPKDTSRLTPDQKDQLAAYIKRVKDFRRESFQTIKPSTLCAPYVDDDLVTPRQWEKEHPPNELGDDEPGDNK